MATVVIAMCTCIVFMLVIVFCDCLNIYSFFFLFLSFFSSLSFFPYSLSLSLSISLFPSSMYTFSSLLPPPFLPSSSLPQIPKSFLSPRQYLSSEEMHTSNEIAIRVIHRQRGTDSVWSLNTLAEKVLTMRDMYQRIEEGSFGLVLVGVANI